MSLSFAQRSGRISGFTLVEILVVMTLMSMVMLALVAAMRTIGQTEERVDLRLKRADEMRVAASFLSSTLSRVSARKSAASTPVGSNPYLFEGAQSAVTWVGVMPARYGAGGRYFFRLSLESVGLSKVLMIRFSPWSESAVFPNWSSADSRILISPVSSMVLEYGSDSSSSIFWQSQWSDTQRLPTRIRISLRTPTDEWPYLVIPMRQLLGVSNSRGGFSLGPE